MQQEKKNYSYFCDCIIAARILTFFKCHQRCKARTFAWNKLNANFLMIILIAFFNVLHINTENFIQLPSRPRKSSPQSSAIQNFSKISKVPNVLAICGIWFAFWKIAWEQETRVKFFMHKKDFWEIEKLWIKLKGSWPKVSKLKALKLTEKQIRFI